MRIYKVTADCLVDFCLCTWYVKASSQREAWLKGYQLAWESPVADSGSVDCERVDWESEVDKWAEEKRPVLTV